MVPDDSSIWLYSATEYTCCSKDGRGTKENIQKVKNHLHQKQKEIYLELKSIKKKIIELPLSDDRKVKWKQFTNWLRTNFRKEDTIRILFSDEKFFDIDGVYNCPNERMWAISRADIDEEGNVIQKQKFPERGSDSVVGCMLLQGSQILGDLG